MKIQKGLFSNPNVGEALPMPGQAHISVQKTESLRCLALRTRFKSSFVHVRECTMYRPHGTWVKQCSGGSCKSNSDICHNAKASLI